MQNVRKLQRAAIVNELKGKCRRCFNTSFTCSKLISSCKCRSVSSVHEDCLIEEIQLNPQFVTQSANHPNFKKYRCISCNQSVFFLPDFSSRLISCSDYTKREYCIWGFWILFYLLFFSAITFFILEVIEEPDLPLLFIFLIIFLLLLGCFFVWLQYRNLKTIFYSELPQPNQQQGQTERQMI